MKIAMIASEANPLCKSGGLADVVYSLSRELNANGEKAIVILPYYDSIKKKDLHPEYLAYTYLNMSWRRQYVGVFKLVIDNIEYYLVDNEYYFARDGLYGYNDDIERFAYFSLAALDILKLINFQPDIIHVHDWQGGMIPCLLKERYCYDPFYSGIKTVLTIHNPAFKGLMDKYFLGNFYELSDELYDRGLVRFENQVSTLKSAIVYADMISTVSPTHRNELLTYELSHGLSPVLALREQDFVGIVNGLDVVEFNPADDKRIVKNYSSKAFVMGKKANKEDLLKSFALPVNDNPTYGLVSRLTWQKGIDLVLANVSYLVSQGANVIILGNGEKKLEDAFQEMRDRYPNNVGIYIGYNDALAHKVYAGSDFFLMPSLFEPCGIGQIIAQRYGTLPLVRQTGGLVDTVINYDDTNAAIANGFSFRDYDGIALGYSINRSLGVYKDKDLLRKLIKNAMELDRSWKKSMNEYLALYKRAVEK